MRIFALLIFLTVSVAAQSGRLVTPATSGEPDSPNTSTERSVKEMFEETSGFLRTKAAEFEAKNIPFNDKRLEQLKLEQRQLAARYAATAALRKDLTGDDHYFVGMLHWIAENFYGATENLQKFISSQNVSVDRVQTARSIVVVSLAKQKKLGAAEKILADYIKEQPQKLTERSRMEGELAKAYQIQKDFAEMAPHAEQAYRSAKILLADAASRSRGLDEILDSGTLVFEANRDLGEQQKADAALDDLRVTAMGTQSSSFYYYVTDRKITYMIETGRKPTALQLFQSTLLTVDKDFPSKSIRDDVVRRLKSREKHYRLLGVAAIEMPLIDQWFPGKPKTFSDLKGKVVLLDFWATWCAPCLEAFPSLKEWQQDFGGDGFEILGLTRYYGNVNGVKADIPTEIEFIKRFRKTHDLPYDIVVAKGQTTQIMYGATALPTAVLIDRKGVIRYIATGTSSTRLDEIRETIIKLLAEK